MPPLTLSLLASASGLEFFHNAWGGSVIRGWLKPYLLFRVKHDDDPPCRQEAGLRKLTAPVEWGEGQSPVQKIFNPGSACGALDLHD